MGLIGLIILLWVALQTEIVQNWLVKKVVAKISNDLKTEVRVKHISVSFFNRLNLEGTLIKDQKRDTLLYAGKLKLRITDWFFFKDKIEIKYVGLEDAIINQSRMDSTWNHQFLIDYFSGSDKTTNSNKKQIALTLKKIDFKNVRFTSNDYWTGQKTNISAIGLSVDANTTDFNKKHFIINEIILTQPHYSTYDFKGLNTTKISTPHENKSLVEMYFNPSNLLIKIEKLSIKNGTLNLEKQTNRATFQHFDGQHLKFDNLNASILNFTFVKDTIAASIDISTKERSGLLVNKLKADYKLTPQIMEFKNFLFQTPNTKLQNYYAMHFTNFAKDFGNYISKVKMTLKFNQSKISSNDIAFFAPDLKKWNKEFKINGNIEGTVDNFIGKNLLVQTGYNTFLNGDISLKGLPDFEKTIINLSSRNFTTNYKDALDFSPSLKDIKTPSLSSLGNIQFKGNFAGTYRKFITSGTFNTSLGNFSTNLAFTLPKNEIPIYKGSLNTQLFNLGKFINDSTIGYASFKGSVDGSGIKLDLLKTSLKGTFSRIDIKHYSYVNITTDGILQKKQYEGNLKISDPNLDITAIVKVDLSKDKPQYNILGDLFHSNLKKLRLTNELFELSGLFDLEFKGKTIDDFTGSAKVFNASLLHEKDRLNFDSFVVRSTQDRIEKSFSIESNNINVKINGLYTLLDLPNSFTLFLNKYYPAYINAPAQSPKNQNFSFVILTKEVDGYLKLLNKNLSGLNYSNISGRINTEDTIFSVSADITDFGYNKYKLSNAKIVGKGNLNNLLVDADIELIYLSDSTIFPNTSIKIVSSNDVSNIILKTRANHTLNELNLTSDVYTLSDGVRIHFNPSSFVLNDKKWNLEKEGEIIIRRNLVDAKNVRFTQSDQEIVIETAEEEGGNTSNLVVKLKKIVLGDFLPLVTKEPRMEGLASGEVVLRDFFGKFNFDAKLQAEQFRLDDDSVGIVNIVSDYQSQKGKINFKLIAPNKNYNFDIVGVYDLKDSLNNPLTSTLNFNHSKISFTNRFLNTIFSDINGYAYGQIQLNGNINSPQILGNLKIKNAGLFVNYTKVFYHIDSINLAFNDGHIDFGRFNIRDTLGNLGTVKGKLYQKQFKDMVFDMDITTNKLLLIDTKPLDNDAFYGRAIGKATLSLKGPEKNLKLTISGEAVDSSHIFIPTTDSKQSGEADFIVFKQYGVEMKQRSTGGALNLIIDLDLKANNFARIDVILDELTGDVIRATGDGNLKIHAGTREPLTMRGRYNIESGSYVFNFQSFIKKPFILKSGVGNYIEWNGDPFNADIKIDAQYVVNNISIANLVGNQFDANIQNYKGDVYVLGELRGKLSRPDVKFKFDFPEGSSVKSNFTFMEFIRKIESDPTETTKQATFLIVFNSFAKYEGASASTGRSISEVSTDIGFRTISTVITQQLNKIFSDLFYKVFKDPTIKFNFSTNFYNANLINGNVNFQSGLSNVRSQFNLGFAKSLLDDRIILSFGSDFDFNVSNTQFSSSQLSGLQLLPNFRIEFILNKSRKLRLVAFYKDNLDFTSVTGKRNRAGGSFSFRTDFDKLFAKKTAEIKVEADKKEPVGGH